MWLYNRAPPHSRPISLGLGRTYRVEVQDGIPGVPAQVVADAGDVVLLVDAHLGTVDFDGLEEAQFRSGHAGKIHFLQVIGRRMQRQSNNFNYSVCDFYMYRSPLLWRFFRSLRCAHTLATLDR